MRVHRRAWVGCLAAVAAMLVPAVSASAAGSHGPLTLPRRLRLAPGDAPRPRVRHARGPRADRARQRPGAHAPQRDERHLRARPVRRGVRLARGAAGRPRLRHARHLAAGARRQPDGRGSPQRAARQVGTYGARPGTPRYWVRVDGINVGMARVALFWRRRREAREVLARARAPRAVGPRRGALLSAPARRVRPAAERRHPRPRPAVAALVLAAAGRDRLRRL